MYIIRENFTYFKPYWILSYWKLFSISHWVWQHKVEYTISIFFTISINKNSELNRWGWMIQHLLFTCRPKYTFFRDSLSFIARRKNSIEGKDFKVIVVWNCIFVWLIICLGNCCVICGFIANRCATSVFICFKTSFRIATHCKMYLIAAKP